jgi:hypothetical protein
MSMEFLRDFFSARISSKTGWLARKPVTSPAGEEPAAVEIGLRAGDGVGAAHERFQGRFRTAAQRPAAVG